MLEVNPDWVTPGWVPLVLVLILAAACVVLYLSLRKHIRIARANDPRNTPAETQRNEEEAAEEAKQ